MFFDLSTSGVNGCFALTFAFMANVARALPRKRRAHVGELPSDSIDATTAERRTLFVRVTARRARKMDQEDVVILEWTGSPHRRRFSATRRRQSPALDLRAVGMTPAGPTSVADAGNQVRLDVVRPRAGRSVLGVHGLPITTKQIEVEAT